MSMTPVQNDVRNLDDLRERLRRFAADRDWEQFHSPKNLSMALIAEAAEVVEHFQWLTDAESRSLAPEKRAAIEHELADVLIYLVRLADKLEIDLLKAATWKLADNIDKYPAGLVKGSSKKYTDY